MLKSGLHSVLDHLPLRVMRPMAGVRVLLPLYHAVCDAPPAAPSHLGCWRRTKDFRADLDLLLRLARPVGMNDVVAHLNGVGKLPRRAFHLTVDDGLRESADVIADICLSKGVHATFFLSTGFLDNRMLGYRHLASLLTEVGGQRSESEARGIFGHCRSATASGKRFTRRQPARGSMLTITFVLPDPISVGSMSGPHGQRLYRRRA